jgi:hypothetical protein
MLSDISTESSPLLAARMAGALWLIVIVAGIVAVLGGASLDTSGDPGTLAANALASASKVRLAFVINFFGKICYLGVTVLLYELFKPVNKSVALFGALCGFAGLMSGAGSVNSFVALSLLEESRRAGEPLATQLQATVKMFLRGGGPSFGVEMVYFGCQILSVGYLIVRSHLLPRAIGVLLLLAGSSYVVVSFTSFVSPLLGPRLLPLIVPIALLGEGALAVWLVVKGVNVDGWRSLVLGRRATINPAAV